MVELNLPRTWGGKLKTAILALNDEVDALGEGGVVKVVRKRLTYDFDHTIDPTPDVWHAGTTVTTDLLPAGTIIENAWFANRGAPFVAGQPYRGIYLNVVDPDGTPGDNWASVIFYDLTNQSTSGSLIGGLPMRDLTTPSEVNITVPCALQADAHLAIHLESDTPFTAGLGTLYVLYSEPAT